MNSRLNKTIRAKPVIMPITTFEKNNMYLKVVNRLFYCVTLILFGCQSALLGQTYEVTGTIHSLTYFGPSPEEKDSFKLVVSGCEWFLHEEVKELKMAGVVQTNNFDYIEASFDGDQFYVVNSLETQSRLKSNPQFFATAQVGSGPIPTDAGSHVRDVWLGFASHCYFSLSTNEWLYPIFLQRNASKIVNGLFAVKTLVDFPVGSKYLPSKVIYTFNFPASVTIQGAVQNISGTNAVFIVESFTNIESLLVPIRYSIRKYALNGELTEKVEIDAAVSTNVAKPQSFAPRLPGNSYVADMRFPSINQNEDANYIATNWPDISHVAPIYKVESNANIEIEKEKYRQTSIAKKHNNITRLVVVGILCTSVIPLIFFVQQTKNNKIKK